jgi:hypothetical protein
LNTGDRPGKRWKHCVPGLSMKKPIFLWVDASADWVHEYEFPFDHQQWTQEMIIDVWNILDQPDYKILHCMNRLDTEKVVYGYKLTKQS